MVHVVAAALKQYTNKTISVWIVRVLLFLGFASTRIDLKKVRSRDTATSVRWQIRERRQQKAKGNHHHHHHHLHHHHHHRHLRHHLRQGKVLELLLTGEFNFNFTDQRPNRLYILFNFEYCKFQLNDKL